MRGRSSDRRTQAETDLLVEAARAWEALRRHAGAAEGSDESRQIARDVMGILCRADVNLDTTRRV